MELDEQGGLYARPAPTPRSKMLIRTRAQREPKDQGQSSSPGSTTRDSRHWDLKFSDMVVRSLLDRRQPPRLTVCIKRAYLCI